MKLIELAMIDYILILKIKIDRARNFHYKNCEATNLRLDFDVLRYIHK